MECSSRTVKEYGQSESNVKYTNTQIHFNTNMQIHKVLKRPHMCYIFEKHGIQRYQT